MAQFVVGVGTSHSPLLAIAPSMWAERARDDTKMKALVLGDGRVVTYAELAREVDRRFAHDARIEIFEQQAKRAQEQLDLLAASIERADLDVLIVVGDDQGELFSRTHMPAVAVYNGAEIATYPKSELTPNLPDWHQQANRSYRMDRVHRSAGHPALANFLIETMIQNEIDVGVASEVDDPYQAGFGHAYGFVLERLCRSAHVPMVPVMLNTYFPPNVPRPGRCYGIGKVIGAAVEAMPGELRAGIVASGGLSHFAVDDQLDNGLLTALRNRDEDYLVNMNPAALRSGNSEILNWVLTAGALGHHELTHAEYIPVHRTQAGTGVGLAFAVWQERP